MLIMRSKFSNFRKHAYYCFKIFQFSRKICYPYHLRLPKTRPYSFSTSSNSLSKLFCRLPRRLEVPNGNLRRISRFSLLYALSFSRLTSNLHFSLQYFILTCFFSYNLPHQRQASIGVILYPLIFTLMI